MRAWLLAPALLCSFLISAPGFAKKTEMKKSASKPQSLRRGGSKWFLSHAEFLKLSRQEQKNYLRQVKRILASLPEKSATFAKAGAPKSSKRKIASQSAISAAQAALFIDQAERWRGEPPMLIEYTNEKRHAEFQDRWKNSIWWTITARGAVNQVPDSDPQKAAVEKRVEEMEDFYLAGRKVAETSFAKQGQLKEAYSTLRRMKDGEVNLDTPGLVPSGALVDVDGGQKISWGKSEAVKPAANAEGASGKTVRVIDTSGQQPAVNADASGGTKPTESATLPVPDEVEADPSAATPSATETAERPAELRGYRCMYSGFVIKNDPCQGPQELPEEMSFKEIDSAKLSCEDGQALCNPLLFGLKLSCPVPNDKDDAEILKCLQSGTPLCVSRGKYATRDCGTQSQNDGHLASAAALIRLNPKVWNDYLVSFYELCDDKMIVLNDFTQIRNGERREIPESTRADIEQTCGNAKKQLARLAEEHRTETGRPSSSPATNGSQGQQ